jgi:xanthine dehydrogenase accessory factor
MRNASHDIHSEIARIKAKGQEAALVTIIGASGSTPSGVGSKMLVRADGSTMGTIGGGSIEKLVTEEALKVIRMGKAKRLNFSLREGKECGMICGGDVEVFIEPILQEPKLFIFGGGHIALALSKMAKMVGLRIVVIDNRADYASPQRFPEAEATVVTDYAQAFSNLEIDNISYIVIVTHGHQGDEVVLERAVKTEAKYIGMIGSRRKNKVIFDHLLAKGIPQDLIDRVHAPIGLEINASTSEEIAVSILAEIVKVRRVPAAEEGKS